MKQIFLLRFTFVINILNSPVQSPNYNQGHSQSGRNGRQTKHWHEPSLKKKPKSGETSALMALCDLQRGKTANATRFWAWHKPASSQLDVSAARAGARCHMSGCIAQGMMYLVHHASLAAWRAHLLDLIIRNDRCCKTLSPWDVSHFTHTHTL